MGVTERVAFARELVGRGRQVAPVARTLQISRQAIYRKPKPRRAPQRRLPRGPVEEAIVETAKENRTDGYRMVWALTRRKLGIAIKSKAGPAGDA